MWKKSPPQQKFWAFSHSSHFLISANVVLENNHWNAKKKPKIRYLELTFSVSRPRLQYFFSVHEKVEEELHLGSGWILGGAAGRKRLSPLWPRARTSEQRKRARKLPKVSKVVSDVTQPHPNTEPHSRSSEQKIRSLSPKFPAVSEKWKRTVV